jgi:hypothetical protein
MQRSRFHKLRNGLVLALSAILFTTAAGCFGRFRAVNFIYEFNKEASPNPVVRSLVMFALVVIPVYFFAFLADWLVLNVVDFFNGNSQMASKQLPDGTTVNMAKLDADTVRVSHVDANGKETSFDVVRVGSKAGYVRAADGRILGTVEQLADGRLVQQAH